MKKGFTIVELLVVIVVIGILAAITVVSYSGVTSKARTAQAQSNANSVRQVADIYYTDNGYYPATLAAFASGSTTTKLPSSISVISDGTLDATNGQTSVSWACVSTSTSTPCSSPTGGKIQYWNFSVTSNNLVTIYVGSATSSSIFYAPTS